MPQELPEQVVFTVPTFDIINVAYCSRKSSMGRIMPTRNSRFQHNGQRALLSSIRIVKKLLEV
jgi:hypothetical protein